MALNGRDETFCQLVALSTSSNTAAYINAGFSETGAKGNASRKIAKDNIQARISEIKAEMATIVKMDKEKYIKLVMEHRQAAMAKDDINAANGAMSLVGKACGILIDKSVIEQSVEQKELTALQEKEAKRMAQVMLRLHRGDEDGRSDIKAG